MFKQASLKAFTSDFDVCDKDLGIDSVSSATCIDQTNQSINLICLRPLALLHVKVKYYSVISFNRLMVQYSQTKLDPFFSFYLINRMENMDPVWLCCTISLSKDITLSFLKLHTL